MEGLIKALEALTPEEAQRVSALIKQDETVPELILSLHLDVLLSTM